MRMYVRNMHVVAAVHCADILRRCALAWLNPASGALGPDVKPCMHACNIFRRCEWMQDDPDARRRGHPLARSSEMSVTEGTGACMPNPPLHLDRQQEAMKVSW